jgi:hypothetical protein
MQNNKHKEPHKALKKWKKTKKENKKRTDQSVLRKKREKPRGEGIPTNKQANPSQPSPPKGKRRGKQTKDREMPHRTRRKKGKIPHKTPPIQ